MASLRRVAFAVLLSLVSASPVLQRRTELCQNSTADPATGLPIVDLGYELHRAFNYNATGDFYNFTNIRYGAPPLGDLRFRKPQAPATDRKTVQIGANTQICPQAWPQWQDAAESFVLSYLLGGGGTKVKRQDIQANGTTTMSEDCLFLDVVVPKKIFDTKQKAPVLVWIYGGGFVAGNKQGSGNPIGLLERSNNEIIYVALNYRLGAFGFLGGPSVEKDGDPNVGLYDQRLALKWVQDNIHLFGGDPSQVTVIGESAGGSSILHQITAFGGKQDSLFQRAIPQSPGFFPIVSDNQTENTFRDFLAYANVSTLAEARQLPTEKLIAANTQQVYNAPSGRFVYGPIVDGNLVPELPALLLSKGSFNQDVQVLAGHNSDEGLVFSNPNSVNDSTYETNIHDSFVTLPQADVDYLNTTLYPSDFSGTQPYHDPVLRQAVTAADIGFNCNVYALSKYTAAARDYEFAIYPGLHGQDVAYTFYTGGSSNVAAISLQEWIVSFTKTGVPVDSLGPAFPLYEPGRDLLKLTADSAGPSAAKDDISAARCEWWISKGFPDLEGEVV